MVSCSIMRYKIFVFIFLFIIMTFFVSEVNSDTIYLKNGRSMEGLIKKEDDKRIELDVGFGSVKFYREEIERIERSGISDVKKIRGEWERQKKKEEEKRVNRKIEKEYSPREVGFENNSEHIIVGVLLNGKVRGRFLLDTGATLTVLSDRLAAKLGIKDSVTNEMVELQVADGRRMFARYVLLESLSVEGVAAENVEAVIMPGGVSMDIEDGLLGMSFLKRFNFQIDAANKKLILRRSR
jgi:clan AA aspartic protease (TIGR02281 family)